MAKLLTFLFLLVSAPCVRSLSCFVTDGPYPVETNEWNYCVADRSPYGEGTSYYGVAPGNDPLTEKLNKNTTVVGPIEHAVIANCVLENYKDSLYGTNEFRVRCYCGRNQCNQPGNDRLYWVKQIEMFQKK